MSKISNDVLTHNLLSESPEVTSLRTLATVLLGELVATHLQPGIHHSHIRLLARTTLALPQTIGQLLEPCSGSLVLPTRVDGGPIRLNLSL